MRIDRAGLANMPDGAAWPSEEAIAAERALLLRSSRERRAAPRLPVPVTLDVTTPLRDVSATGLRYRVGPHEVPPAVGDPIEGAVRLDAETVIEIRGRVIRRMGPEVAIELGAPVSILMSSRYFGNDSFLEPVPVTRRDSSGGGSAGPARSRVENLGVDKGSSSRRGRWD